MIAVDTNLLVYAHREDSPWHVPASKCLQGLAEASSPWVIPWPCLHEFFAIVTHPRIYTPPTPLETALDQISAWLESPSLVSVSELEGYWSELHRLILAGRIVGAQVHDAKIAALCQTHGVTELWSADRDFSRFSGLKIRNPLVEQKN